MKRKLNLVRQAQDDIAQSFGASPPVDSLGPHARVSLTRQVSQHMEMLFKSQKDLCDILETTAKTWRDLKTDEGVREGTAQRVLIEFISLLRKIATRKIKADKRVHDELVPALDKIYAPFLSSLNFDALVVRRDVPRSPDALHEQSQSESNG